MNDLVNQTMQLPDTLEDLSRFVLINEERVQALRAQIRAIRKVNLAKEVYEQKLAEAQEIGQITVEAAQKMGELLLQIQKQSGGDRRSEDFKNSTMENFEKTKHETTTEMGMSPKQVSQYQQMAQNPEAVQAAIKKAIERGDVVSRTQVMKEIHALKEELRKEKEKKQEVKEVVKIPEDYEQLKRKARQASAWEQDYNKQRDKVGEKQREILRLQEQVKRLQEQTVMEQNNNDMTASAIMFAMQCRNFIETVGGYVFISEHLQELPERERKGYITSAQAVHDWAQILLENIERSKHEILE